MESWARLSYVAQFVVFLPSIYEAWGSVCPIACGHHSVQTEPHKMVEVGHTCNFRTQDI